MKERQFDETEKQKNKQSVYMRYATQWTVTAHGIE